MAKRNKKSSGFEGVFMLVLFICIALISGILLLWPLFFVYLYLVANKEKNKISRVVPTVEGFWINDKMKQEFKEIVENINKKSNEITRKELNELKKAMDAFDSLPDARITKNGLYDERSKAGKDRNIAHEKIGDIKRSIRLMKSEVDRYEARRADISEYPRRVRDEWCSAHASFLAAKKSLIAMFIIFPGTIISASLLWDGDAFIGFQSYYYNAVVRPSLFFGIDGFEHFKYLAEMFSGTTMSRWATDMLPPLIVTFVFYFVVKKSQIESVSTKIPKPPLVTVENLDSFSPQSLYAHINNSDIKENTIQGNDVLINNRSKKNTYIAAFLTLTLGFLGAHKYYVGNWGFGLLYLLSFILLMYFPNEQLFSCILLFITIEFLWYLFMPIFNKKLLGAISPFEIR